MNTKENHRRGENRRKIAAGTFTLADISEDEFATAAEVAAIFRTDPRTIRARCASGVIPSTHLGEYRIPVAWLLAQAQAGQARQAEEKVSA